MVREELVSNFQSPPAEARPRVWWHWLNGNISREGIRKDLEWMQSIGIGGLQNFDVNFAVPTIVDQRIPYMSDEWKDVYRYSVTLANELDLEFGIAASPGWSETGGPWVKPEDGMKKLVWSETQLQGGTPFHGKLAMPPTTTGPFQDMAPPKELNPTPKSEVEPTFYGDVAVLAYPAIDDEVGGANPVITLADGTGVAVDTLIDGKFNTGTELPRPTADKPLQLLVTYPAAQTVRSATVFFPDVADIYSGATMEAALEVREPDGDWRSLSDIHLSTVPTTVSFETVEASQFRVSLKPVEKTQSNSNGFAPGFNMAYMEAIAKLFGAKSMAINELQLSSEPRIHQFEVKAGFSVARDYYALESREALADVAVPVEAVIDLTDRLQADGSLEWTPPAGKWTVLRVGYSLLGKTNHPAVAEATGLEVDKLDGKAVRAYVETYIQNYREAVGADLIGPKGISAILTDSTEVGAFNWTPGMLEKFSELRGYDARPWLPTLVGKIVGSRKESDKFLYDFRRTISELHATEHYGTVAQVAHENGLEVYSESLEGWRPSLGDDMGMRRFADYPMAAFWSYRREEGPKPLYFADTRGAASVAHLYGRKMAAAESMTSTRHPWEHVPKDLKRVVDLEMLHGINRIVIHSSVHQPVDDRKPGLSLRHIGQFFNRHTAWADMARPWIDYIARSSYLLQQGRFVADVGYFYGEEAPLGPQTWDGYFTDVPTRYGYDFVNPDAVMTLFSVKDGNLVTAGGASYKVLYLGGTSRRMTLGMLKRLEALVLDGATIVGQPPGSSPARSDDEDQFHTLVNRLWSGKQVTNVGKGRVIASNDVESALGMIDVVPDVEVLSQRQDTDIQFVHRQLPGGDIYFLSNRNNHAETVDLRFRVSGKAPQLWNAATGEMSPVSYRIDDGVTTVPLGFAAEESGFLVFLDTAAEDSYRAPEVRAVPVAELGGFWSVSFQEGHGVPSGVVMEELTPLNENSDVGIKYFSGVSSYRTTFDVTSGMQQLSSLLLDLGKVGDLAEVLVNGKSAGIAWLPPYRVDISGLTTVGENQLEIRVANRWVNRLIGDMQPDAEKITFTVTPTYQADAPLRESGLMGPVTLMTTSVK